MRVSAGLSGYSCAYATQLGVMPQRLKLLKLFKPRFLERQRIDNRQ